jgi:D-alanine--D-alanine ligase
MRDPPFVAVVMGGPSAEREVSLNSGTTIVAELSRRYRVKPVQILADGRWEIPCGLVHDTLAPDPRSCFTGEGLPITRAVEFLLQGGVDVVFNALHGPMGEDGTLQGFLSTLGVPFTGPDVIPAAVTMDKRLSKQVLQSAGLVTPPFFTLRAAELRGGRVDWARVVERESAAVPLPWVFKPNRLGSSVGVGFLQDVADVVQGAQELIESWPESAWQDDLLVERAASGRELTCGVMETNGQPIALPPIEIRPRSSSFFDYHAKYTPGASEEICPAALDARETEAVQETAIKIHRLFECAPLSRTDMFLTPENQLEVLEINTLPGLTDTSLIPLSASKAGIALGDLLSALVDHAVARATRGGWSSHRAVVHASDVST